MVRRGSISTEGFTRLELLVSVLVLLALTGVAWLLAGRSRSGAIKFACDDNLKQFGIAANLYSKDNEDRLPYAFIRYDGTRFQTWDTLIWPYVPAGDRDRPSKRRLQCPADELPSSMENRRRSYSMPAHHMGTSRSTQEDWPPKGDSYTGLGLWWQPGGRGKSAVSNIVASASSETTNAVESGAFTNGAGAPLVPAIRTTMIMAPADTLLLTERAFSNNIAFHYSCANIRSPSEHVDKRAISEDKLHGGRIHYLMVDGHVEKLYPLQSLGQRDERDMTDKRFPNIWTMNPHD